MLEVYTIRIRPDPLRPPALWTAHYLTTHMATSAMGRVNTSSSPPVADGVVSGCGAVTAGRAVGPRFYLFGTPGGRPGLGAASVCDDETGGGLPKRARMSPNPNFARSVSVMSAFALPAMSNAGRCFAVTMPSCGGLPAHRARLGPLLSSLHVS